MHRVTHNSSGDTSVAGEAALSTGERNSEGDIISPLRRGVEVVFVVVALV